MNAEIGRAVEGHALALVRTSIQGIGALTVARLLACLGDPAFFRSAAALASYVDVVPATNQSGLSRPGRAPVSQLGNSDLRAHLRSPRWSPRSAILGCGPTTKALDGHL